ncbi:MAG: peptidase M20 [Proteobacteria bacterium SG_bin9]|nr:MAG: peptidase M20 [Proteobacteria bacterium SG_bin9]
MVDARSLVLISIVCLAGLSSAIARDAKLLAAAEQAKPALIETLRDLVQIESGSSDTAGLARMADYLEPQLKAAGMTTERRKTVRGALADIVIGTMTGTGTKRLMLIAHMDTVYQRDILATQPYRVDGNKIYGPGIADDKGGLAVILHALKILQDANWRDYAKLTVVINPDEEAGSVGSGDIISEIADQHDYVLSCEPSALRDAASNEALTLGTSGIATAILEVKGRASHAGVAPLLGANALVELSHQILQTRDVAKEIPGTQLSWTVSQAGTVRNQIPEKATAYGDIRLTVPDGLERLRSALQAKIDSNKLVPGTEITLRLEPGRPAFVGGPASVAVAEQAMRIYAEIDRKLDLIPMTGGGTDAAYAARNGKAVVVEGFGLGGFGYHARDEFIVTDSIVPRLYLVTRLLNELAKK